MIVYQNKKIFSYVVQKDARKAILPLYERNRTLNFIRTSAIKRQSMIPRFIARRRPFSHNVVLCGTQHNL